MLDYIKEIMECLDKVEPKASSTKSSIESLNLSVVDEDGKKLSKQKYEILHKLVANILFPTKRARPNTGTAIFHLTTRVIYPDQRNWLKMVYLFKYVRGTKYIPLILSADKSVMLQWYIDGSYTVRPNMREHSGGGLKMVQGLPILASRNQNINTRSSPEPEIVGFDQLMPSLLWTRFFLNLRAMESLRISYSKTIRVLLFWKRMISHLLVNKPNIST